MSRSVEELQTFRSQAASAADELDARAEEFYEMASAARSTAARMAAAGQRAQKAARQLRSLL